MTTHFISKYKRKVKKKQPSAGNLELNKDKREYKNYIFYIDRSFLLLLLLRAYCDVEIGRLRTSVQSTKIIVSKAISRRTRGSNKIDVIRINNWSTIALRRKDWWCRAAHVQPFK